MRCVVKRAAAAVLCSAVLAINAYAYDDVTESFWGYTAIASMEQGGVLAEVAPEGGMFFPGRDIQRGEFVTVLMKAMSPGQEGSLDTADAADVDPQLRPYIGAAQRTGVFYGTELNGKIYAMAGEPITRQDAAVLVARLMGLSSQNSCGFDDEGEISDYAFEAVSALCEAGILSGRSENRFEPRGNVTRAEAVSMVSRAQEYKISHEEQQDTVVTTVAGVGGLAYRDGAVKSALFARPRGLAVRDDGSLIVIDTDNNVLRCIKGDTVSTVAGELIARDSYGEAAGMYKDGKVEKAYFNKPSDAVEDSSQNLIVADSQNHSIRIVRGANVYTYCGSLSRGYKNGGPREAKFDTPEGIAIDAEGNVYVADTGNSCIRKIDKDRNVTLFAGQPGKSGLRDGKAEQAMFFEPSGIAVDKNGTVYVADTGNQRIRSIKDGVVTTVAGGGNETVHDTGYIAGGFRDGSCTDARFSFPKGICVADNGVLFVADTQNNAVRAITQFGEVVTVAGTGETGDTDGSVLEATLHGPVDVCFAKGSLYVADTMNSSVRKVEVDMAELAVKGGTGDE